MAPLSRPEAGSQRRRTEQWTRPLPTLAARPPTPYRPRAAFTLEHGLALAGILLAVASGTFAGAMISRTPAPGLIATGADAPAEPPGIAFDIDRHADWDKGPTTTGSLPMTVRPKVELQSASGSADEAAAARFAGGEPADAGDYRLLRVADGAAVLESAEGLRQVRPGAVLPGAGRVDAIEFREGRWVVVTAAGLIRTADEPESLRTTPLP